MRKTRQRKKKTTLLDVILSVIVVVKNDADIVQERILAVRKEITSLKINYEILVIDNGSEDTTVEKIRDLRKKIPHIRILILSKAYETDVALTAGLDNCIGDYAVVFNIYTDPPTVLSELIQELKKNNDIVMGTVKREVVPYSFFSKLFLTFLKRLSTHQFEYRTNYLVAVNRRAINAITRTRRKSRNFSYLNSFIGLKKSVVLYTPIKKFRYKLKKESFFRLFFTVTDIVISNSYKPIRIFAFLGVIASIVFLLYVLIITIVHFFFYPAIAPQGWISTSAVLGVMFFFLFSLLTLIAEYIIRTLHETRNDPLYFISDEVDTSVILTEQDKLNVV